MTAQQPADGDGSQAGLPLSALLSQALVAFTIEADNEAEHRMPHRTTSHGRSGKGASATGSGGGRGARGRGGISGGAADGGDAGRGARDRSGTSGGSAADDGDTGRGARDRSGTSGDGDVADGDGAAGGGATGDSPGGPWLVSLVMWENCLRYLTEDGITVAGLTEAARTATNLDGMRRWGYLRIDPPPPKKPGPRSLLYPTPAGMAAQKVWRPVLDEVESRWQTRLGAAEAAGLRSSLGQLAAQLPPTLPDALPILSHGLFTRGRGPGDDRFPGFQFPSPSGQLVPGLPLSALLSRVLVTFAVEFERETATSLAISANILRVLGDGWTPVRDLPALAGVSRESVSMATGFLTRHGQAEAGAPAGPGPRPAHPAHGAGAPGPGPVRSADRGNRGPLAGPLG